MGAFDPVGTQVARLFPGAEADTLQRLERAARQRTFCRRDILRSRGFALPPFVILEGHVIDRRVAETGQVYAALIAGPGYLGGIRSVSDPEAEAFYELVALTDGSWATWDPRFLRELALEDAGLAVSLLDQSAEFAAILNIRLDERSFETARQRMAAILTRYGKADLRHAAPGRSASRHGGDDRHEPHDDVSSAARARGRGSREARTWRWHPRLDEERLASLVTVASPEGAPTL